MTCLFRKPFINDCKIKKTALFSLKLHQCSYEHFTKQQKLLEIVIRPVLLEKNETPFCNKFISSVFEH
ncbi:hypothetical protein M153_2360004297 [Pseudoloma neurophilia]|uniref:Uncharacterized protein n=1 Tax=Pseudoloma neurophilia TaxID=146866 RepID=A0A0R0LYU8_9MICR|nr:hypothetical protein M153_2360004297 [Pseudoloma neurophilia]